MNSINNREFNLSQHTVKEDIELLPQALDASMPGIIMTNNRLPYIPIIYCNKAFEEISIYSRIEVIGHNCRFLQKDDCNQLERETLRDSGYNIIKVKNSLNIYELIEKVHPDMLLLGLWMLVLSEGQMLKSFRKNSQTESLPVIVIYASKDGKNIVSEAEAYAFLGKPFNLDFLRKTIKHHLN